MRLASKKNNNVILTDNHLSVYIALNDMDIIMPTESLVRNQGWDDSGIHCPTSDKELAEKHMKQEISSDVNFEYVGTGFEYYDDNKNIYVSDNIKEIYYYLGDDKYKLRDYIRNMVGNLDEGIDRIISLTNLYSTMKDGGTKIYKSNDYDITVIVCNTLIGNKDIFIGDYSLEYNNFTMCKR